MSRYKDLRDGELILEAQMQDPHIEPALIAEAKNRAPEVTERFFAFITLFLSMPKETKEVSDHIQCPCWITGEFKWQWDCPAHPHD